MSNPGQNPSQNKQEKLIQNLRAEATEVKHCFTLFSFQVMTFGSVLFAVILQYSGQKPFVGFIGVLMAVICIYTARIGNHKYGTANRNNAYELHLQRLKHYRLVEDPEATEQMRNCGWEEAMFAWRIVHSTIYDQLYIWAKIREKSRLRMLIGKRTILRIPNLIHFYEHSAYPWFDTKLLAMNKRNYSPGRYLFHMHSILNILAVAALAIGLISGFRIVDRYWGSGDPQKAIEAVIVAGVMAVASPWSLYQILMNRARRRILESGLDSIQSSAVLWRCAVIAHFRALERSTRFQHYTANLCMEAEGLATNILKVHVWMAESDSFPSKPFRGFGIEPPEVPPGSVSPF